MNAPLDTVIAAYKLLPNAQLAIIPNAPHPVFIVNFEAVWAVLHRFLKISKATQLKVSSSYCEQVKYLPKKINHIRGI